MLATVLRQKFIIDQFIDWTFNWLCNCNVKYTWRAIILLNSHLKWHIWPAIQLAMGLLAAISEVAAEKHHVCLGSKMCTRSEKLYLDAVKFRTKSNTGIHDVSKEGWPPYSVLQEVPLRLVSSPPQSYRCASPGCDFAFQQNFFCKIRTLNNLPPAVYCGQHQNTHVVELIVPITLL